MIRHAGDIRVTVEEPYPAMKPGAEATPRAYTEYHPASFKLMLP